MLHPGSTLPPEGARRTAAHDLPRFAPSSKARLSACSSPASSICSGRASALPRSSCWRMPARGVEVPRAQTCCGQPAYNSGDRGDAAAIARQVIEAFEGYDYVVAPSGSCAGMLQAALSASCSPTIPTCAERAEALAAKSYELDVVPGRCARRRRASMRPIDGTRHLSRFLLGPARARRQRGSRGGCSRSVEGLTLVELTESEVCCGFGGTFSRQISGDLRRHRRGQERRTSPPPAPTRVLAGDLGCLMQHRRQAARATARQVEARHVAEVLAGMTDDAGDRRAAARRELSRHGRPRRRLQGTTPRAALADARAAAGAAATSSAASSSSARTADAKLPEFEALRDEARDIKDHTLAHLDLYLEAYEREGDRERRPGALRADRRRGARHRAQASAARPAPRSSPRASRWSAEEIALNDHLEADGIDAGRDRSRRIHHPAPPRAAEPHHRAGDPSQQGADRGGFPPRPHAISPRERDARPSRAISCAEARAVLREKFLAADVGITGANFLIAETGSSVIVTNEGNGDLTQTLPRMHIVIASIEKIVPTLEDAAHDPARCWRARRPARRSPPTRPSRPARAATAIRTARAQYHVVLLDNGRSEMLGGEFQRHAALHPLRRLPQPLPGLCTRSAATPMAGSIPGRWARC